ncbi:MAG: hypothetical protein ACO34J_10565 [Prochlorothrix sp.]
MTFLPPSPVFPSSIPPETASVTFSAVSPTRDVPADTLSPPPVTNKISATPLPPEVIPPSPEVSDAILIPTDTIPRETIPRETFPLDLVPSRSAPDPPAPKAKAADSVPAGTAVAPVVSQGGDRVGAVGDRGQGDRIEADRGQGDRGQNDRANPQPSRNPGASNPGASNPGAHSPEASRASGSEVSVSNALFPEMLESEEEAIALDPRTIALAADDVRRVMHAQDEQGQTLTTKLNILFVTNGALLTSVSISRLMAFPSRFGIIFNIIEVVSFFLSFSLLISAFFPRQVVVSPNLQDQKFLERYLPLQWEEYQLQMLVNLVETYNANRQRLDDVSQSLRYAAYATWLIAGVILCHMVVAYSFS